MQGTPAVPTSVQDVPRKAEILSENRPPAQGHSTHEHVARRKWLVALLRMHPLRGDNTRRQRGYSCVAASASRTDVLRSFPLFSRRDRRKFRYTDVKPALMTKLVVRLVNVLGLPAGGWPVPRLAVEAVGAQAADVRRR